MRRLVSFCLTVVLLLAGCTGQPTKPVPVAIPVDVRTPDAVKLDPILPNLVTESVPGGFRLGPFNNIYPLRWFDKERLYLHLQHDPGSTLALLDALGGKVTVLASRENGWYYENAPVLGGQAVLFSYGTQGDPGGLWLQPAGAQPHQMATGRQFAHISPTGASAIAYPRCGGGKFVDLRSGEAHDLETPDLCGAGLLDAWSPNGARYVTQAPRRDDATPGFRFFDDAGRPAGSFHEPGNYSMYPAWSPDGKQLAFLSIPLDQFYLGHPEAVFEPLVAPRLGVLDFAAGTTRYFSLPGLVVGSRPLWSPNGQRIAVTFGKPHTSTGDMPLTEVEAQRIVAVDLAGGTLQPLSEPIEPSVTFWPVAWSPGSKALVVGIGEATGERLRYSLLRSPGDAPVPLPGDPTWLSDELLAVIAHLPDRLLLVNTEGKVLRQLAHGQQVRYPTRSPDGRYLAYTVLTQAGEVRRAGDPPADYVVVLDITAQIGVGAQ